MKIGDTVTILTWAELALMFHADSDGDLELTTDLVLQSCQKPRCGGPVTIEVILDNGELYGDGLWFTAECTQENNK